MSTKCRWLNGTSNMQAYYESGRPAEIMPIAPVTVYDDFIKTAIDATNDWTFAAVNSGSAALTGAINGAVRLTTGAADDDDLDLATTLGWNAALACGVEIRLKAADVTAAAFCIGFSDATGEAADKVAIDFSNSGALVTTATDAVCFVLDPDKTANATYVHLCSVKNNTDGTPVNTGVVPVVDTYNTYRIEFDSSGNVKAYIDGNLVGSLTSAITTTVGLCVYIGCINREAAANAWDVDYVRAWQRRV